jgi:hypothetical protein
MHLFKKPRHGTQNPVLVRFIILPGKVLSSELVELYMISRKLQQCLLPQEVLHFLATGMAVLLKLSIPN